MTLPHVRYCRPATLPEAIELAGEPGAVPLAGGQSLLPLLALRRVRPGLVVDLAALESELGGIRVGDRGLEIGALARQQDLLADQAVRDHAPLLAAAARLVANPQVRTRGTLGGALAHRDPPAELPTALAALGATVGVRGPKGERTLTLGDGRALDLHAGELITHISVPSAEPRAGWAFDELAARFAARPLVAVAAAGNRVAIAGLTAGPLVLELDGDQAGGDAIHTRLGELALVPDARASVAYRVRVAATLAARSLERAAQGPPPDEPPPARARPVRVPRTLPPAATIRIAIGVNGHRRELSVAANRTLAEVLREELGLTATHLGCEHGVCGSCNVLVDGAAVRSCLMLAAQADGGELTTVEGLRDDGALDGLLPAFVERQALQCGFCTPGMLVTLAELEEAPADRRALREQLVGNLCRCTGYRPILDAAQAAL